MCGREHVSWSGSCMRSPHLLCISNTQQRPFASSQKAAWRYQENHSWPSILKLLGPTMIGVLHVKWHAWVKQSAQKSLWYPLLQVSDDGAQDELYDVFIAQTFAHSQPNDKTSTQEQLSIWMQYVVKAWLRNIESNSWTIVIPLTMGSVEPLGHEGMAKKYEVKWSNNNTIGWPTSPSSRFDEKSNNKQFISMPSPEQLNHQVCLKKLNGSQGQAQV